MKYLKSFEYNIFDPEYVIVNPIGIRSEPTVPKVKEAFYDFINNNVGLVISKRDSFFKNEKNIIYSVAYFNVPKTLKQFFMFDNNYYIGYNYYISVKEEKIIKISKNKEDIELYITSKKYNL